MFLFCSETQISFTEDATDEEISETIRAHKNIIQNIREQHLPMGRKLKVLNRSKNFLKRHEGELKQSKQAKDLFAKYKVYYERVCLKKLSKLLKFIFSKICCFHSQSINRIKRELANLIVVITPWEMRIKKIESLFLFFFLFFLALFFLFLLSRCMLLKNLRPSSSWQKIRLSYPTS